MYVMKLLIFDCFVLSMKKYGKTGTNVYVTCYISRVLETLNPAQSNQSIVC